MSVEMTKWNQAFALLALLGDSKPMAELLRQKPAPLRIQQAIADLIDPPFPKPIRRLKLEWDRRELAKLITKAKRIADGTNVERARRSLGTGKLDAAVRAIEDEGKSRAYLYKAHGEARELRQIIHLALTRWSREELEAMCRVDDPQKLSAICDAILRLQADQDHED